jgi:1-acyl-sn-glycerol-3-phosphate acyltransferase
MIRSLIILLVIPLYTVVASFFAIPIAQLTRSPAILYFLGRLGVRMGLAIAGVRVRARGREKIAADPHLIYMSNHSSNLDGPVVFTQIPGEVKALGKKEVFRLPVLARVMRLAGFISVDRSDRTAAIRSMQLAAAAARQGASFFLAPEGTRSSNGELLPFKKGGFHMALEAGVPIMPITIRGARELMPRGSFAVRPGVVEVVFHDPVPTAGLTKNDMEGLVAEVRNRIASGLAAPPPLGG